jgi:hypothetical protein
MTNELAKKLDESLHLGFAVPRLDKTPTGADIMIDLPEFPEMLKRFGKFLTVAVKKGGPFKDAQVIFWCGTVVRVALDDAEFEGYTAENYELPKHRIAKASRGKILENNKIAWESQKVIPGEPGKAIRQAYAKMLREGYIYPGGQPADRMAFPCEKTTEGDDKVLWQVYWTFFGDRVFNLALVDMPNQDGANTQSAMGSAATQGGGLRRYDYIAPEVAAVVFPDLTYWKYDADNKFVLAGKFE